MASNNELLLSVVSKFQNRLIMLLNKIGQTNGRGIKGEIIALGEKYNDSECGISKEKTEKYEKMIADFDKSDDTPPDTPPGSPPSNIQEDDSGKLNEGDIKNYVFDSLILSQRGIEYFSGSTGSAAVKPEGEDAGEVAGEDAGEVAGQQGGYKVKTLFYKKGDSVSVMKKETEQDESNREDEFFRYYTLESDNDIYLHVVKDDGQNESELDDDDVKKIMDAGFKDSNGIDINLPGEKSEDGIDRVNKFVIQVKFKEGDKVTSIPVWDSSLITTRTGEISKIFLEKNNKYISGFFMFHFPFGKIVNSLNDDEGLNKLRSISQRMRGGEGEDGNAVINFYITLYGYTSDPTKFGEKILSFNFQVLSENNPLYANNDKYQPESDEMTLEKYLEKYVVVGSPGQQSVIKRDSPVDPQPQQGPESAEIENVKKLIQEKEEEIRLIREPPINLVEWGVQGSERQPEIVEAERNARIKSIEEKLLELQSVLTALRERAGVGGGKKKRTYKKKKKRRSKKKRTPIKRRIKYKE